MMRQDVIMVITSDHFSDFIKYLKEYHPVIVRHSIFEAVKIVKRKKIVVKAILMDSESQLSEKCLCYLKSLITCPVIGLISYDNLAQASRIAQAPVDNVMYKIINHEVISKNINALLNS